jgi:hypothetical protein
VKNFVCWDSSRVNEVINIDADFVPDPVFWAVDTEAPLAFRQGEATPPRFIGTDELVKIFLDPRNHHYQLAVIGPAGAGKSHLIHRLRSRVQSLPGIEVLAVRRLETNLRAVLDKLVERLPAERRAKYREELEGVGLTLANPEVQKATLLDSIARTIQDDTVHKDSGIDASFEEALIGMLPDMLGDPYLRNQKFLRDGEVVPELVDRLFSNRGGKRLEERIEFDSANLPLSGIRLQDCCMQARQTINLFNYDSDITVPAVLAVINRNLNRAIAHAHNFSGDRLGQLMGEIRRFLKAQGKQLVILFEEFARLQGYDAAMLSALLVQGDSEQCNVRWALACTSGRFRDLPDTVRDRMDALIDMETEGQVPDLLGFAGRYLNAVRVGRQTLEAIFKSGGYTLPNACDGCDHQPICHSTFGTTEEGYGLYPFSASAVRTMAKRADADAEMRFNPREFQGKVLRPILIDGGEALEFDAFPTSALLDNLGRSTFDPSERLRLQEKAGEHFGRYQSLFQLWNEGRLANLPEALMTAFGLEPLQGLTDGPRPPPPPPPPSGPTPVDHELVQLRAWIDGGFLDQKLAQNLREALFDPIVQSIDWDDLGLLPTTFAGRTTGSRPFRTQSINFVRQATSGGGGGVVRLELPLIRDDRGVTRTAQAMRSILLYGRNGDWSQAGGLEGLASVLDLAGACAAEVVSQIRALRGDPAEWDPIAGAIELLIVGSALGGQIAPSSLDDEALLDAIFKPTGEDCQLSDTSLRSMYQRLRAKRTDLQDLVRAHVTGAKGGDRGRFINPAEPVAALRNLRRGKWRLRRTPQSRSDLYKDVGDLYRQVSGDLPLALERERKARLDWLKRVDNQFGVDVRRQVVIEAATESLDFAARVGLPLNRPPLERARDAFGTVQFAAAAEAVRRLRDADPPEAELPSYARAFRSAVEATDELIKVWDSFLTRAEAEIAAKRREYGGDQVDSEASRVKEALAGISDELTWLESDRVPA